MKFNYCAICGEKRARALCPECHNFYHARCGRIKNGVRICENCASIQVTSQPGDSADGNKCPKCKIYIKNTVNGQAECPLCDRR